MGELECRQASRRRLGAGTTDPSRSRAGRPAMISRVWAARWLCSGTLTPTLGGSGRRTVRQVRSGDVGDAGQPRQGQHEPRQPTSRCRIRRRAERVRRLSPSSTVSGAASSNVCPAGCVGRIQVVAVAFPRPMRCGSSSPCSHGSGSRCQPCKATQHDLKPCRPCAPLLRSAYGSRALGDVRGQ